eukprot:tig00020538_g10326.t1
MSHAGKPVASPPEDLAVQPSDAVLPLSVILAPRSATLPATRRKASSRPGSASESRLAVDVVREKRNSKMADQLLRASTLLNMSASSIHSGYSERTRLSAKGTDPNESRSRFADEGRLEVIERVEQLAKSAVSEAEAQSADARDAARRAMDAFEKERDELLKRAQVAEESAESLRQTVELMRVKLRVSGEREIMHERKLKAFSGFEPIFKALSERHYFKNAAEVIDRLETLESAQTESYTQLLDAQEQKGQLERQMAALKAARERERDVQRSEVLKVSSKAEAARRDLQAQLEDATVQLAKAREASDRALTLQSAINDLYHYCARDTDLADTEGTLEQQPNMSDPLQVISAIGHLLRLHAPKRAGRSLQDMSALANSIWMRFFSTDQSLRFKPKEIFERLAVEVEERTAALEASQKRFAAASKEIKTLRAQLERVQFEKRLVTAELESRKASKIAAWAAPAPARKSAASFAEQARPSSFKLLPAPLLAG